MSRARTFQEKGNAQKEILPKQVDFFRRLSWGMRKYRIHCHESGELSMKHQGRWDSHTVLLRSALLRFSFFSLPFSLVSGGTMWYNSWPHRMNLQSNRWLGKALL